MKRKLHHVSLLKSRLKNICQHKNVPRAHHSQKPFSGTYKQFNWKTAALSSFDPGGQHSPSHQITESRAFKE